MNTKIVYHHIPKCGGNAIVRTLALKYFPKNVIFHGKNGNWRASLNVQNLNDTATKLGMDGLQLRKALLSYQHALAESRLIHGHYPFFRDVAELHPDWQRITLIRDPVKRWYSEYFYNRYKQGSDHKRIEISLDEYIESEQGQKSAKTYCHWLGEDSLPQALENLKYFSVIGILEDLENFQRDLNTKIGKGNMLFNGYQKVNASPISKEQKDLEMSSLSALQKSKIEEMCADDMQIYQHVLKTV